MRARKFIFIFVYLFDELLIDLFFNLDDPRLPNSSQLCEKSPKALVQQTFWIIFSIEWKSTVNLYKRSVALFSVSFLFINFYYFASRLLTRKLKALWRRSSDLKSCSITFSRNM